MYEDTEGDEVEDLYSLLAFVKQQLPEVQAMASGAIASDYQRTRVERVSGRLGLVSLAYLWQQPQAPLLQRMVSWCGCMGGWGHEWVGGWVSTRESDTVSCRNTVSCRKHATATSSTRDAFRR